MIGKSKVTLYNNTIQSVPLFKCQLHLESVKELITLLIFQVGKFFFSTGLQTGGEE